MSRNKQVDRLREGLKRHIAGRSGLTSSPIRTDVDINKIKDVVDFALQVIRGRQATVNRLEQEQEITGKETEALFQSLHDSLLSTGIRRDFVVNRSGAKPISLGELGFVEFQSIFEKEDKVKLIVIVEMIINHLRDQVLEERKIGDEGTKRANKEVSRVYDCFHDVLFKLGIWKDPMPGTIENMVAILFNSYQEVLNQKRKSYSLCAELRIDLDHKQEDLSQSLSVIEQLTGELKYQLAATKQVRRELKLLRRDDIDRAVSGDKS